MSEGSNVVAANKGEATAYLAAWVAGFIGTPSMNLHPARIIRKDTGLKLDFR